jgi:drug/metabolite transporter (DMT)-like permease
MDVSGLGLLMPLVYLALRRPRGPPAPCRNVAAPLPVDWSRCWPMASSSTPWTVAPMGAVSALRETSVLFAALIGHLFLGESLGLARLLACAAIAAGTVLIG